MSQAGSLGSGGGGGGSSVQTLTGNSGGAVPPTSNNINTVGTGSITVVGNPGTSTLTTELTGLTANAVLYGQGTPTLGLVASGTTGQVLQTNTGAPPTYSTATYPSTTTIDQILYSSANNTVSGLATVNNSVLTTSNTGVPTWTSMAANGDLLIGSGSGPPTSATLTAGSGVTITNGPNSITISSSGGGSSVLNLLQTQTLVSGSSLTFTSGFSSSYNHLLLTGTNYNSPTIASSANLLVQISTDGGATYITTGYGVNFSPTTGLALFNGSNTQTSNLSCNILNFSSGSGYITSSTIVSYFDTSGPGSAGNGPNSATYETSSTIANAFRLVLDTGENFGGTFSLYGYTH